MVLNPVSNTVTNDTTNPGKVLAVGLDGRIMIAGSSNVKILPEDPAQPTETLPITNATAGAFSVEGRAYIVAGSTLYVHAPGNLTSISLQATGNDVAFLANGAAVQVHGERELVDAVVGLMHDPVRRARLGAAARALVDANRGAKDRTLVVIMSLLSAEDRGRAVVRPFRVIH